MAIGRVGQHDPGDEGAQSRRKPDKLHQRRTAEYGDKTGDNEQFTFGDPADNLQQWLQQILADGDESANCNHRIHRRQPAGLVTAVIRRA